MKTVRLKEALHGSSIITGDYQLIRGPYNRDNQRRDVMFKIMKDGAITRIHAYNGDYVILGGDDNVAELPPPEPIDLVALGTKIEKRFKIMAKLTEGAINGNVRALILSGAPGIGKSFNLEERLERALRNGEINKYTILKGKISAIALYAQLFLHQDEGDILILDDIDIIFQDSMTLDLLKGALDTGRRRHLDWKTASTWLDENGIDDEFDFNGCCIFITNMDFDRLIEKGSALTPHLKALMSRSIYLDLAIHTPLEIMVRVEQVVNTTSILDQQNIDDGKKKLMMEWLWGNYERMRELSIRSVLKIGNFMNTDMSDWSEMAEVTMIKGQRM